MLEFLSQPWPWYVAGPVIGLMVPLLLLLTGRSFGVSSSLRHLCAATVPGSLEYFRYDWKRRGLWNLLFVAGIFLGGLLSATWLASPAPIALSPATVADLQALGITDFSGLAPIEIFNWANLTAPSGMAIVILGGFLLGFGARYADGCTSGHAIMGMSNLEKSSLIAVLGFFAGDLAITYFVYPALF